MINSESYRVTVDLLVTRIRTLISKHPEIMTMESPWELFKVPGFKAEDLSPSLAQASWALVRAQTLGPLSTDEK